MQEGRPIAYGSRTLSKTKSNNAPIERECLAIVLACKLFDQYVSERSGIIVKSDHKPLEEIFKYKKGGEMHIVNLLSRTDMHRSSNTADAEAFQSRCVSREAGCWFNVQGGQGAGAEQATEKVDG